MEKLGDIIGLIGFNLSSLNGPGSQYAIPFISLKLGEIHFLIFSLPLSGVIRIGPKSKSEKSGKN